MIDVFGNIRKLLVFESDDDFYYLQILQRRKENSGIGSSSRVIKNYYVNSVDYLEKRYEEIKAICNLFNARAMLRLNKRSYTRVAFKAMQNIANSMANGEYSFISKSYDRAVGNGHNDDNKKWIVDIDVKTTCLYLKEMIECINNCQPQGDKFIIHLPTKNGEHLITKPFDVNCFKKQYPQIDIHKDNPINLYIP